MRLENIVYGCPFGQMAVMTEGEDRNYIGMMSKWEWEIYSRINMAHPRKQFMPLVDEISVIPQSTVLKSGPEDGCSVIERSRR